MPRRDQPGAESGAARWVGNDGRRSSSIFDRASQGRARVLRLAVPRNESLERVRVRPRGAASCWVHPVAAVLPSRTKVERTLLTMSRCCCWNMLSRMLYRSAASNLGSVPTLSRRTTQALISAPGSWLRRAFEEPWFRRVISWTRSTRPNWNRKTWSVGVTARMASETVAS